MRDHPYFRATIQFFWGCLLGAAIWALSPTFTGHAEPWDASHTYYFQIALLLAGAFAAGVWPAGFCIGALGVYLGQLAYMWLFLPKGPMLYLGSLLLGWKSLYALLSG